MTTPKAITDAVKKAPEKGEKTCFVACPIGPPDSPQRKRTEQVLAKIIRPACEALGYQCLPAHEDERPGKITRQIVQRLVESPLVIADLTGPNPNVMYEVGIRNAARKPIVLMCQEGQDIPFDLAHNRAVKVDWPDWDSIDEAREKLEAQIRSAEEDGDKASESPVTEYHGAEAMLKLADQTIANGGAGGAVIGTVLELRDEMRRLGDWMRRPGTTGHAGPDFRVEFAQGLSSDEIAWVQSVLKSARSLHGNNWVEVRNMAFNALDDRFRQDKFNADQVRAMRGAIREYLDRCVLGQAKDHPC